MCSLRAPPSLRHQLGVRKPLLPSAQPVRNCGPHRGQRHNGDGQLRGPKSERRHERLEQRRRRGVTDALRQGGEQASVGQCRTGAIHKRTAGPPSWLPNSASHACIKKVKVAPPAPQCPGRAWRCLWPGSEGAHTQAWRAWCTPHRTCRQAPCHLPTLSSRRPPALRRTPSSHFSSWLRTVNRLSRAGRASE